MYTPHFLIHCSLAAQVQSGGGYPKRNPYKVCANRIPITL